MEETFLHKPFVYDSSICDADLQPCHDRSSRVQILNSASKFIIIPTIFMVHLWACSRHRTDNLHITKSFIIASIKLAQIEISQQELAMIIIHIF
jgi:hypothetical protein